MIVLVAMLLTVFVGGIVAVQALEHRPRRPSEEERRANILRILETRHARGDIDRQELEQRRRDLLG